MSTNFRRTSKHFDLIVIGAGGAGLSAALSAKQNGVDNIALISKVFVYSSHTVAAKGGINAALGNVLGDSWKWHAFDTIKGGDFLADVNMVETLCKNAPQAILDLEKMGVVFSRDDSGKISQRQYGAQTSDYGKGNMAYRSCYSKDETGHTILHSLYQQLMREDVKFFSEYFIVDLLLDEGRCYGCLALDLNEGQLVVFEADNVIIASGGYSQIYQNTTSSKVCSGDLLAYSFENGVPLQDMEFVQFHPTGIANLGFLVSEAARGEGAYLLNCDGLRFMQNYEPKMMELASRDKISRAMGQEVYEGRGCGQKKNYLYLDLRHLSEETLVKKIPGVVEVVKNFLKIDVAKELVPVSPSAHYTMGGLAVDEKCQVLDRDENVIDGFFAVGEAACLSVHGANRLGCNSLLDLVVFGQICGKNIKKYDKNEQKTLKSDKIEQKIAKFSEIFDKNHENELKLHEIKQKIKENNEKYLGVFRDAKSLKKGFEELLLLKKSFENYKINTITLIFNDELVDYFEVKALLINSIVTNFSAINRKESRGAHFRRDFAQNEQNFLAHSLVYGQNQENDLVFRLKDVELRAKDPELADKITNELKIK